MRFALVLLIAPATAAAEPPPPAVMPELVARDRLEVTAVLSTALIANLAHVQVGGTVAIERVPGLELFGAARAGVLVYVPFGGAAGVGSTRVGARYHRAIGAWHLTPSVWGWLPTVRFASNNDKIPAFLDEMLGSTDGRVFTPEGALGGSLSIAHHGAKSFTQAELGAALVLDNGPQVDTVFAAIGYGTQLSRCTSILLEYRLEISPPGERAHGPALAFGFRGDAATIWRLRMHPYLADLGDFGFGTGSNGGSFGVAVAFDIVRRFR